MILEKLFGYGGRKEEEIPFYAGTDLEEILNREGISIDNIVSDGRYLVKKSGEDVILARLYQAKKDTAITVFDGISFCKKNGEIKRNACDNPCIKDHPEKIVPVSNEEYDRMRNDNYSPQLPMIGKTN